MKLAELDGCRHTRAGGPRASSRVLLTQPALGQRPEALAIQQASEDRREGRGQNLESIDDMK